MRQRQRGFTQEWERTRRCAGFTPILMFATLVAATLIGARTSAAEGVVLVRVQTDHVCMINNQDMGKLQMPVPVDDKIYYGCCAGCVKALTENTNDVRYATDPVSGARVDKASAVIGALPDKRVYYFESEKTFDMLREHLAKQ